MAKKEDYVRYVNMAKKLITKYGTDIEIVMGLNPVSDTAPFDYDATKIVTYHTTGVIMPPVRGIYFQGTRFGFHSTYDKDIVDDKMSCFVIPVYDENGAIVDLSEATQVKVTNVAGDTQVEYKIYFCDVMKPAEKVILFSFGVGR